MADGSSGPADESNPWTTLGTRRVYENPWIDVREDRVLRPDGHRGIYGVVHYKNLAIGVLPVEDDGQIWLVGQYRYPLDVYSWEIPEGGGPPGESPEESARRELLEETGLEAEQLELFSTLHLSNSVCDEVAYLFRATGLRHGPSEPEGTERLQVKRVTLDESLEMMEAGTITDAMTVVALLHESRRRSR